MHKLNFDAPFNSLSLGNVSLNFFRELKKKNIDLDIFPMGNLDFSAFDKLTKEDQDYINENADKAVSRLDRSTPTLKVWHIQGSEKKIGDNQFLYTFYEVDSPTEEEVSIVKAQNHVFFSCSEAAQSFKDKGCDNVSYVPLGFDPDFHKTNKEYLGDDLIHFGLIGKMERRKNTQALIQLWSNKFGNNPRYQLTCLVENPFIKKEQMDKLITQAMNNQKYSNINFLPRLKTNSEVNDLINSIDIDISGLSNGEGWNLPAFNATSLGKWSIVSNCSSHKDWATKDNAILVDPVGKQPCYDNAFFVKGHKYNQGEYYRLHQDGISKALDQSVQFAKSENTEGLKLQEEFTYAKTVEKILEKIY
tara:strand:- start:416 stop:1498 length:1083 start_codon:yes stop_codon:yes gene_type:complete